MTDISRGPFIASVDIRRYSLVAMTLHWLIAAAILANIALAWFADDLREGGNRLAGSQLMQLHKSIGMTVLVLTLIRLAWRLVKSPPPMHVTGWQKTAAHAMHWLFYALMILMPLSGLAIGNARGIPNVYFSWFIVPALPFLPQGGDTGRALGGEIGDVHSTVGWIWLALIGLHVLAALKHHFLDRDDTLARMVPGLRLWSRA